MNELNMNISEIVPVSISNLPENVIDKSAEFAEIKYKSRYSWSPSPYIENKIMEMIFER
jgi:hypothetical protein